MSRVSFSSEPQAEQSDSSIAFIETSPRVRPPDPLWSREEKVAFHVMETLYTFNAAGGCRVLDALYRGGLGRGRRGKKAGIPEHEWAAIKISHGAAVEYLAGERDVGTAADNREWLDIIREPTTEAELDARDAMQRQIEQTARDVGIDDFVDYGNAETLIPPEPRASSRPLRAQQPSSPPQEPARKRRRLNVVPNDTDDDAVDELESIPADRLRQMVRTALKGADLRRLVAGKRGEIIGGQTRQSIKAVPAAEQHQVRDSRPIVPAAKSPVPGRQDRVVKDIRSQKLRTLPQPPKQVFIQHNHEMVYPNNRQPQQNVTPRHREGEGAPMGPPRRTLVERAVPTVMQSTGQQAYLSRRNWETRQTDHATLQTVPRIQDLESFQIKLSTQHTTSHGLIPRPIEPRVQREPYPTLTSRGTSLSPATDNGHAVVTDLYQHRGREERPMEQTVLKENHRPLWGNVRLPTYLPPPQRMVIEQLQQPQPASPRQQSVSQQGQDWQRQGQQWQQHFQQLHHAHLQHLQSAQPQRQSVSQQLLIIRPYNKPFSGEASGHHD